MPRILTVDDSRAVRAIVSKQVKELGMEVDEAEDGQQGLARLEEVSYDLVLLDVTMPVMDGPAMLGQMRQAGNKTPVVMLTSESKRSIVSDAMKLGINGYILKPFRPEELVEQITKVVKAPAPANGEASPIVSSTPGVAAAASREVSGSQFLDVLVVDDMENVAKRLKSLLPEHVTVLGATSAQAALSACRDKVFRVVLVDTEIPDVDSAVLGGQLKVLQPHSALLALALRSTNPVNKEWQAKGFADVMYKPFTPEAIEDFALQYFDKQELLVIEDNVLKVAAFVGRQDRVDRYFSRLWQLFPPALERIAAACFDEAIIDLSRAASVPDKLPKLITILLERSKAIGVSLRLVGTMETRKVLGMFEETRRIIVFPSVDEARAA